MNENTFLRWPPHRPAPPAPTGGRPLTDLMLEIDPDWEARLMAEKDQPRIPAGALGVCGLAPGGGLPPQPAPRGARRP